MPASGADWPPTRSTICSCCSASGVLAAAARSRAGSSKTARKGDSRSGSRRLFSLLRPARELVLAGDGRQAPDRYQGYRTAAASASASHARRRVSSRRLLSVLTLCLGYLLIVVTKRRQALHDLIAGTLVAHDGIRRRPAWVVAAYQRCRPACRFSACSRRSRCRRIRTTRSARKSPRGLRSRAAIATAIEAAWRNSPRDFADLTSDSLGAGLPRSGRYVESIEIVSGMIVITYGAAANEAARRQRAGDRAGARRSARSAGRAATASRRRDSKPCSKDTPATRPSSNATSHRCAASTRHEKPIVPAAPLVRARGPANGVAHREQLQDARRRGRRRRRRAAVARARAAVVGDRRTDDRVRARGRALQHGRRGARRPPASGAAPGIKAVKDCAAGAVLVASVAALAVAAAFVYDVVLG